MKRIAFWIGVLMLVALAIGQIISAAAAFGWPLVIATAAFIVVSAGCLIYGLSDLD